MLGLLAPNRPTGILSLERQFLVDVIVDLTEPGQRP